MAKKFSELRAKMSPERRKRNQERTLELLSEMPLNDLRRAREMTQETIAEILGNRQAAVSRIEKRTDMYVSTLARYIAALGGELEIVARFPEGDVRINQFESIGLEPAAGGEH
ncbi:MAG: XRE family transcriptional regulator [Acidobacteriota bacterium]